jgi:hypothetical protein
LDRLKQIIGKREKLREQIKQIERMRQWVLDAEHILDGSWAEIQEQNDGTKESVGKRLLTNKEVGLRLDHFLQELSKKLTKDEMSQTEHDGLAEFLRVLHNLKPHLVQCYDLEEFPRTNNDMEGAIRKIKTRYRRISGRKKWNTYLLRYGRSVAFYEWWNATPERWQNFECLAKKLDREDWKEMKKETLSAQSEQLKRFRFRHKRKVFLRTLEERWGAASKTDILH